MIKLKLHCRSRKHKLRINQWQCSTAGLAVGWFFCFCFRLRQPSFYWIISDGAVNGIGRNGNVLILSPDSDSDERMTAFATPIFDFHLVMRSLTIPTPSLVKTSLKATAWLYSAKYLRNRKHVPCFYRVIQARVEVWENEKCCGNTSRRRVFPQLFRVLPNFHSCLYNSIETRYMFSISSRKHHDERKENTLLTLIIKM